MNKKQYNKLLNRAVKEHRNADYAKTLLTPIFFKAMKKIGKQRLVTRPNEDDKRRAIRDLEPTPPA